MRGGGTEGAAPEQRRDVEPAPAEERRGRHDRDAVPAAGQAHQRVRVAGLEQDAGADAGRLAGRVEPQPRGEVAAEEQHALVVQLGHLEGAPAGEPVPGRHHGQHPDGEEGPRAQLLAARHRSQRQVQLAAGDPSPQPYAAVLHQPHVDPRPRPAEAGQERVDQALEWGRAYS
jgi:hypothetical protein